MIKRLKEKNLTLVMTDEAKEFLIEKGTSLDYGARPLRRAIEQYLEDPLSEDLLRGTFAGKDTITVKTAGEKDEKKLSSTPPRRRRRSWWRPAAVRR